MGRRSSRGEGREGSPDGQAVPVESDNFELLHELHRNRILNYCCRFTGDFQLAEELTQETFLRLYRHLDKLSGDVLPWLYRVASNLAKNAVRDRKRRPGALWSSDLSEKVSDPSLGPRLLAEQRDLEARVSRLLERIPARYREVLLLCDLQDLSYDEAARVLGVSRTNVGVRLYRARRIAARWVAREKEAWE